MARYHNNSKKIPASAIPSIAWIFRETLMTEPSPLFLEASSAVIPTGSAAGVCRYGWLINADCRLTTTEFEVGGPS